MAPRLANWVEPNLFLIPFKEYAVEQATIKEALDHLYDLANEADRDLNLVFIIDGTSACLAPGPNLLSPGSNWKTRH